MEDKKKKTWHLGDLKISTLVSFAMAVFAGAYLVASFGYQYWAGYGPGAGFMPRWCSGALLALSLVAFFQSFRQEGMKVSELFPSKVAVTNLLVTWGALVFFVVFCKLLGFVITTTLMLFALFTRGMKWKPALIWSIAVAIICFLLFKSVLMVQVPVNQFGW